MTILGLQEPGPQGWRDPGEGPLNTDEETGGTSPQAGTGRRNSSTFADMDMYWTHLEFKSRAISTHPRPSHQNPFSTPTEGPQHCLGSEEVPTQGGPRAHLNTGVVATDCCYQYPSTLAASFTPIAALLWTCGHVGMCMSWCLQPRKGTYCK